MYNELNLAKKRLEYIEKKREEKLTVILCYRNGNTRIITVKL